MSDRPSGSVIDAAPTTAIDAPYAAIANVDNPCV
jgi:hypothetical protein